MRKLLTLLVVALVGSACLSPFYARSGTDTSVAGVFGEDPETRDTLCLGTVRMDNGERSFLLVGETCDWTLCYTDDGGKTFRVLRPNLGDEYDFWHYYALLTPDQRYLYIAGDVMPNSTGWLYRYHVYRLDTRTLAVQHITDCAALWKLSNGFGLTVCAKALNPDAPSYQQRFLLCDVEYNFDGTAQRRCKSYSDNTFFTRHPEDDPIYWDEPTPYLP